MRILSDLVADESGATAIEYAVIGALVSIVIVTALTAMGTSLNAKFTAVSNGFK